MPDRLRILFTEGTSLSARQTLYSLGRHHTIDILDPNPLCQCRFSSFVRRWYRSPSFWKEPEEFLGFLAGVVRGGRYDVLLPTHEQVYLLSRFRDAFTPHVGLALPEFATLEKLHNKAQFSRLLSELELPQPETTVVRVRADFDQPWHYPFYLKLAHSTAGGGVFYIETPEALRQRVDQFERVGLLHGDTDILIQHPARGVLSTAQAVFNQGQLIGIHAFESRRLGYGGMSTARTSADHPAVREHVARIGRHVGWHGAFFLDYFYDRDTGQPEYIEANPRIGETVNALASGVNLPELLVRVSRGESPPRAPLGRVGVRTHNLFMNLMTMAYDGRSRLALLGEIGRYLTRQGLYAGGQGEITRPYDDPLSLVPHMWVTAQLLAWPPLARRIVRQTIKNYSLPESATAQIRALPLDLLDGAFSTRSAASYRAPLAPSPP